MKKALLLHGLVQLAITTGVQAQPTSLDWIYPWDEPFAAATTALVALPNGNTLWVGNYLNNVNVDLGLGGEALSTPGRGSFFGELAGDGMVLDVLGLECSSFIYSKVVMDPVTGGKIIHGYFGGTLDMDPSPSVVNNVTSSGGYDAFVIALDANDLFQWGHAWGADQVDDASSAAVDNNGDIYLFGRYDHTVDFDPGPATVELTSGTAVANRYVLKFNADGTFAWVRRLYAQTTNVIVSSLLAHPNGDIYLVGGFTGTVDLDPSGSAHNVTSFDAAGDPMVLRLNGAGDFVWARTMPGTGTQSALGTLGEDGSLILNVNLGGSLDIDPGDATTTLTSNGDYDACIVQLSQDGELGWWHLWGGAGLDVITTITVDHFGLIHCLATFTGAVDLDPTEGVSIFNSGADTDMSLSTFTPDGVFLGVLHFGAGASCSCVVRDLAARSDGSLMITGDLTGSCDMDPTEGETIISDLGFMRRYIMRVLQDPGTGIPRTTDAGTVELFPNPTTNEATIRCVLPQGVTEGSLVLFDERGAEVERFPVRASGGVGISTSHLAAGTYTYQVETAKGRIGPARLVVIK